MGQLLRGLRAAVKPLFVVAFWLTLVGVVVLLATPQVDQALGKTPQDWAKALSHPHAEVRQAAAERLSTAGRKAVEALRQTAFGSDLDSAEAAVDVLRQMYRSPDPAVYEAVQQVLDELDDSENTRLRGYLSVTRPQNADLRLSRSLAAFEALGGTVRIDPKEFTGEFGPREAMTAVVDAHWRGGDAGLVHLRRMPRLRIVQVYHDAPVTQAALDRLAEKRPHMTVVRRGDACMGVSGIDVGREFRVVGVEAGSGAEAAGLRPQDVLVEFAGSAEVTYQAVATILFAARPGDVVPVTVRRGSQTLHLEIPLGRHDPAADTCPCAGQR